MEAYNAAKKEKKNLLDIWLQTDFCGRHYKSLQIITMDELAGVILQF